MFTGLIQQIGTIRAISPHEGGLRITVHAPGLSSELKIDDSVAINGVCQTVVQREPDRFTVVAVEETLRKTTFGSLPVQQKVNLELPLRLGDRLGGHLVLGHVDCVGRIAAIKTLGSSWMFSIAIPDEFEKLVIPVGSIAVDGVSLTIAAIDGLQTTVSIIPHTMENTIFSTYAADSAVNLEFDMIGKYVQRLVTGGKKEVAGSTLTSEQLLQWGYKG
jgi:riboflavin synthase